MNFHSQHKSWGTLTLSFVMWNLGIKTNRKQHIKRCYEGKENQTFLGILLRQIIKLLSYTRRDKFAVQNIFINAGLVESRHVHGPKLNVAESQINFSSQIQHLSSWQTALLSTKYFHWDHFFYILLSLKSFQFLGVLQKKL